MILSFEDWGVVTRISFTTPSNAACWADTSTEDLTGNSIFESLSIVTHFHKKGTWQYNNVTLWFCEKS